MTRKINYESLDELVYKRIKAMILNNELKPGTKIIQHQLAEELAVSRTPVHRALSQLAREHLVKIIPRGGTYVRDFSKEEMITIFEMREVLEGLSCRKAALVVSKNRLSFFRDLYKKAMKSAEEGDWKAYKKADEKFHFFLIESSRIDLLREIAKSFHIFNILSNRYIQGLIRPPQETFPEHMALIDALEHHDPDLSEKLMREHIRKSIRVMRQELTTLPERN